MRTSRYVSQESKQSHTFSSLRSPGTQPTIARRNLLSYLRTLYYVTDFEHGPTQPRPRLAYLPRPRGQRSKIQRHETCACRARCSHGVGRTTYSRATKGLRQVPQTHRYLPSSVPLEEAIGWAWQSRIDGASENGDVNGNGVNWKRTLQLARAEAMRRAREGEAEVWSPPPESPPPVTAIDAARRFGFGGGDVGIGGEWAYLCTLGRGGQGEAVLWASVRFDDHGNAIDVSTSVPPFIKSPWVRFHRSRWKRSPTVSTALGGQRQLFREDLEE